MKSVGIVLGGGGARGLSHIGLLRVFEENKIPMDIIAGTSMGAIIGACYAINPDIETVYDLVRKGLKSSLFSNMKFKILREKKISERKNIFEKAQNFIKFGYMNIVEKTKHSLLRLHQLENIINFLLPDIDISETKIPFACVATDLTNGQEKIFTKGSLRKCVMASSSIPGIFPPVVIDNIYYNDGGAVNVTPIKAVKTLGADIIIANDVKSKIVRWDKPEMAGEIISRSNYITGVLLNEFQLKEADLVVYPDIKHLHWSEFEKINLMIEEGEKAAKSKLAEIKGKIKRAIIVDKIKSFFSFKDVIHS